MVLNRLKIRVVRSSIVYSSQRQVTDTGPEPNKEHRSDDEIESEEHRSDEEPSETGSEPIRKHPVVDAPNPFLRTRSRRIKPPKRLMTITVNARDEQSGVCNRLDYENNT